MMVGQSLGVLHPDVNFESLGRLTLPCLSSHIQVSNTERQSVSVVSPQSSYFSLKSALTLMFCPQLYPSMPSVIQSAGSKPLITNYTLQHLPRTFMQRYKLEDRIGNGSYSEVFRGVDQSTGEICALKIMKHPWDMAQNHQQLQVTSLKMFAGIPSVISLKESFINDGNLVLVFQLLESNLIDYYKSLKAEERSMPQSEIRSVIYQLALALDAMHRHGYAHRDIKPENVLVTHDEEGRIAAKLVDFGLTKKLERGPNTNYIATRWYRSPELLLNMNYDLSVDIFALGCLIVELYLGFEAFPGSDAIDQLNKIFAILGTPNDDTWPEGVQAINEKRVLFPEYEPIDLRDNITNMGPQGIDLVKSMLVVNPKGRISMHELIEHPYFNGIVADLPSVVLEYLAKIKGEDIQQLQQTIQHEVQPILSDGAKSQSTFILESKFVESIEVKSMLSAINQQLAEEDPQKGRQPESHHEASESSKVGSRSEQQSFPLMQPLVFSNLQDMSKIGDSGLATANTSHRTSTAAPMAFNYGQTYQQCISQPIAEKSISRTNSLGSVNDRNASFHPKRADSGVRGVPTAAIPSFLINLQSNPPQTHNAPPEYRPLNEQQKQPFRKAAFSFNVPGYRQSPVHHQPSPPPSLNHNIYLKHYRTAFHSPVDHHTQHYSNPKNSSSNKAPQAPKMNYTVMPNNIVRTHQGPQTIITPRRKGLPVRFEAIIGSQPSKNSEVLQRLQPVVVQHKAPIEKLSIKKPLNISISTTRPMRPDADLKPSESIKTMDASATTQAKELRPRKPNKNRKIELTTHVSRKQLLAKQPQKDTLESFCCNNFCRSGSRDETIIQPKKQCFQPSQ